MAMRISTSQVFETGAKSISQNQASLLKTQQQISANRRLLTPADDPIAAARALEVTQQQSINSAWADNRVLAKNALTAEEGTLADITTMLQNMKTLVVQAGNSSLDGSQRKSIAADLRAQYTQLLGMVNAEDGTGNYLFAGFQNRSQPFSGAPSQGVSYSGDQGQIIMQVGPAREMAINDNGIDAFLRIPNKGYGTSAALSNTGNLAISALTVATPAAVTGHDYEVVISGVGTAGGPQYAIYDTDLDPGQTGTPVATGAYVSGAAITVGGLSFNLSGTTPANGDVFSIKPQPQQDLFKTLDKLIGALENGTASAAGNLRTGRAVSAGNDNLDSALDHLLTVRASVGSRLRELDALDSGGDDRKLQYQSQLSSLQDLDYVKAISDFNAQQTVLEAAQKLMKTTTSLSLFNML